MGIAIPELPRAVRASQLLHGSNADFITNAYLALQHQWPDRGGFEHYMHLLGQPGMRRATVLREIAASESARHCGTQLVDDLPDDHDFRPEDHCTQRLAENNLSLRLGRTVADVTELRQALKRLTADELASAVEGLVLAQQAQHAQLESRLNALEARPAAPQAGTTPPPAPPDAAWRHLAAQQIAMGKQLAESRGEVAALRAELAELKSSMALKLLQSHQELKRQVAEYVNAMAAAQRTQADMQAAAPPTPAVEAARAIAQARHTTANMPLNPSARPRAEHD